MLFADEPTGNLDSATSGEILELVRAAVTSYGQTTVMVTHDAKAATIADRVLFLADGVIVKELGRSSQGEILEAISELVAASMTRVALRGLLGRKLRAALTAVAIVLGVAMVTGTFVLTDTIDRAFTTIFSSAYDETDAVVTGTKTLEWSQTGRGTVSPELLAELRGLPQVEAAAGTILDVSGDGNQATIVDKEGEPIVGNNPTFGLGVDPQDERFNPFQLWRATGLPARVRSCSTRALRRSTTSPWAIASRSRVTDRRGPTP